MTNIKDGLRRIELFGQAIRPGLEEITGLPLDLSNMEYVIDDRDLTNDTDVIAFGEIMKEGRANADWRDKIGNYTPLGIMRTLGGIAALKFMGEAMMMKYNEDEGIAVDPRCLEMSDAGLLYILAHELIHPMDDQHFKCVTDTVNELDRYNFIRDQANITGQLIDAKHDAGLVKGYITKSPEVKSLEAALETKKEETSRFMTVLESHANYVQAQWLKGQGLQTKDVLDKQILTMALWGVPLMLNSAARKKVKQYQAGMKFIEHAYGKNADMGFIYENVPTSEEFAKPELYFESKTVPSK